jgi:hypothetical protein
MFFQYVRHLAVCVCLLVASSAAAVDGALQDSFVWSPSAPTGKQVYAVFRKTLELKEKPKTATLRLFADSRYILWINGKYVNRGPCRFDPKGPEYDTLDVARFLQAGPNILAIVVHSFHDGADSSNVALFCGRIMRHAPGLTAMLEANGKPIVGTDPTWRVSTQNRFGPSPGTWSSIIDHVDARRDSGDWAAAKFDDSAWEKAVPIDGRQWGPLRARHIPLLRETEVRPLRVVQRQMGSKTPENLADKPPLEKLLPMELAAGDQAVIDAGRFVQAYCEIDMTADEGSRIDVAYAQTFFSSGRKPGGSEPGGSHYTTRKGRQTFTTSDTFGCKYVVIRCALGKVRLLGVKLVNRLYPFDVVGKFECNDPLVNNIWQLGVNTIQTCSEDAHVDCATRERTEWLADAVMVGYPIARATMAGPGADGKPYWSDPRLFGSALRHIGQSVQPDGRVKARHPSDSWDIHGYIEDYCCLWIQSLRTWRDRTGDLELVREMWPAVTAQLKWFLDRRTDRGLVKAREFVYFGNPLCYKVCEGATLNAFLAKALFDASELARLLGDSDRQREYAAVGQAIKTAIHAQLWDEKTGAYHGGILNGAKTPCTVHAAACCLYYDIVPTEQRKQVEQWFSKNIENEGCLPYQYAFYFEILARMNSDEADRHALDLIRRRWAVMSRFETQTTFEDFGPCESCHEAGGPPTIYLSRHVLGVDTVGPAADRRLVIKPHLGDLTWAKGIVVTELGPVSVSWKRSSAKDWPSFEIDVPAAATARLLLPAEQRGAVLMVDGQPIQRSAGRSGEDMAIELAAGRHRGGPGQ